ncbi:MAG: 30S ribosomal protein S6 [Actinobacteria bacterium]|nr:MAG: 30S ribosomal protein S6 [Actinomycetota bacterium]
MSAAPPTYDLVLMLDPEAEDATRAKLVADARSAIESQGELVRHDEWGKRALAYPIGHRSVAEYHLMQFHTSSAGLLSTLDRSLRIADEALRFRIVKLRPGTREAPDMRSGAEPPSPSRAPAPARQPAAAAAEEDPDEPRADARGEGEGESPPDAEASGESAAEASSEQPAGEQEAQQGS